MALSPNYIADNIIKLLFKSACGKVAHHLISENDEQNESWQHYYHTARKLHRHGSGRVVAVKLIKV